MTPLVVTHSVQRCFRQELHSRMCKLQAKMRHRTGGGLYLETVHTNACARQSSLLSLEASCVALPSINTSEDYHSLRLPLLPIIQREIGEGVWTKLEFGH